MADLLNDYKGVSWTSPNGRSFNLKTLINEYSRKHIGQVKENPKPKAKKDSKAPTVKKIQDSNDTFTDLGLGGRDISLECYFVGNKHYAEAESFVSALGEVGKSTLKLAFGDALTVNVLNFSVKNDLTKNVNSTIVNVTFHETSKTTYPKSTTSKTKEIKNAAETAKTNVAQNLASTVSSITTPTRLANFTSNFSAMLNKVSDGLDTINNTSLNSIMTDILSQTPANNMFTIAKQLGLVMYKAASTAGHIKNEFTNLSIVPSGSIFGQWTNLLNNLILSSSTTKTTLTQDEIDNLLINDSSATMALISLGESLIEKEYETRAEAVEAARVLKELEQEWTEHIENELSKITELETFLIRDNALGDVVDSASSEILERSYELKVEKTITLSEDTTCVDLAFQYYEEDFRENPDATIDYLIRTNGFSDENFFLLRRGTEVKLYV